MTESSLAWLDLNEEGRQKMQEHLALLDDPGTLDELGIGQIRDVFSDLLFPGTSTLWRRAKYMLFVPWIYQELERDGTGAKSGRDASRQKQTALIRALKRADDRQGLIGTFNEELQQMPDGVVWNGLRIWGVRVRDGSMARYQRELERSESQRFTVAIGDEGELLDAAGGTWWHASTPRAPDDLYERATFELNAEEAEFLRGRLHENHPDSLLARMLEAPALSSIGHGSLWEHDEGVGRLDPGMQEAADHARIFSGSMEGAGLLYSHLVAKARGSEKSGELAERLDDWSDRMDSEGVLAEIKAWPRRRDAFHALTCGQNPGISDRTVAFIDAWMDLACTKPRALLGSEAAYRLIRGRERWTKRRLARLSNPKALDGARDESGTDRLDYRWRSASQIINDIARSAPDVLSPAEKAWRTRRARGDDGKNAARRAVETRRRAQG